MNSAEVLVKFKGDTKDLDDKTNKASSAVKGFSSTLKTGLGVAGATAAAGLAAAGAAVVNLTKQSVEAYAEYEQLIGGVETLFKDSADKVEGYANRAYITAGLSANQYMSTVTSFSASLLQSLGNDTDKAADYADRAIQDMADNANKMGTDISMIQNAYQGFAKQNYMMLDNLKLGYGGNATEMQRLISDASKLTEVQKELGITVDANDMSFANIVNAISVVQKNMDIMGTTSEEAGRTIQGSLKMAQSSWSNLVAGFSKEGADLGQLVEQFVTSVKTFLQNLLPTVARALQGIATALPDLVKQIADMLPDLLESLLPPIIDAVINLLESLSNTLPSLMSIISQGIIKAVKGIVKILPQLIKALIQAAVEIINALAEALPELLPEIINAIIDGILMILDHIDIIIDAGIQLLLGLIQGIISAIPVLIGKLPLIIQSIINGLLSALPQIIMMAPQIIMALIKGLIEGTAMLIEMAPQIIESLIEGISSGISKMWETGKKLISKLWTGIKETWNTVLSKILQLPKELIEKINEKLKGILQVGKDLVSGLWNGIKDKAQWAINKIKSLGSSILKAVKGIFGIHSPSKEFEFIGKMNMLGLDEGMEGMKTQVQDTLDSMFNLQPSVSGSMHSTYSPNVNVVVNNEFETDPLGQLVNKIKTFSGGAKNDYNWGATK